MGGKGFTGRMGIWETLLQAAGKSLSPPDRGDKINWEIIDKPVKSIRAQDSEITSLHVKTCTFTLLFSCRDSGSVSHLHSTERK